MKRVILFILIFLSPFFVTAQNVQRTFAPNIATAQLYMYGNQQAMPVYVLNSSDRFELGFDDLEAGVKNYYYTYQLCDYNWQPANLSPFDYIKGFTINRINTYRNSSISFTRYTHYQAFLPERGSVPTRSGNYLLKVFLDGDTSKTVFTKQFVVVDVKAAVSAQVVQPFTPNAAQTSQRVKFTAVVGGLNSFSAAQQIKAVVIQNNRWDLAQRDIAPTFVRANSLEFNMENVAVFPAMKEWRWLDLTSFRLQSDRVARADYGKTFTNMYLKPDFDRSGQRYLYFPDYNGNFSIRAYENINPQWQGDYATTWFTLAIPQTSTDIYLAGAFTNYERSDRWKMKWNENLGVYEDSAYLKQGYYNYTYLGGNTPGQNTINLEGDYWETENTYTILIYYKAFADRNDQLIGISQINSRADRPGFSF